MIAPTYVHPELRGFMIEGHDVLGEILRRNHRKNLIRKPKSQEKRTLSRLADLERKLGRGAH